MYRALFLKPSHEPVDLPSIVEIKKALKSPAGFLWVSLESATDEELDAILHGVFNFHHLAIEDCQSLGYRFPRLMTFPVIFSSSHMP